MLDGPDGAEQASCPAIFNDIIAQQLQRRNRSGMD
jgi:hypothetical protein